MPDASNDINATQQFCRAKCLNTGSVTIQYRYIAQHTETNTQLFSDVTALKPDFVPVLNQLYTNAVGL